MSAGIVTLFILLSVSGAEEAKRSAPAGGPESPDMAKERAADDEAFRETYLLEKERLFAEHAGEWLAIAGGEVFPADGKRNLLPAKTLEECLAAAERKVPRARHRYVFRIGEEGEVRYSVLGFPARWTMSGIGLYRLLGLTVGVDGAKGTTTWRLKGKEKTFPVGKAAEMGVKLADPTGKGAREVTVGVSTGFNGVALLEPPVSGSLGLARFEIPGATIVKIGGAEVKCRRARVRLAVPEIDLDVTIPVTLLERSGPPEEPGR
jgi:hypothetical protein